MSDQPYRNRPDAVATAGSCFAQHIARHLSMRGLQHFVAEPAHPFLRPDLAAEYNYGTFSCRYGNVYPTRQLVQLIDRAYDRFSPAEDVWEEADG